MGPNYTGRQQKSPRLNAIRSKRVLPLDYVTQLRNFSSRQSFQKIGQSTKFSGFTQF